jgi:hypothetical protein
MKGLGETRLDADEKLSPQTPLAERAVILSATLSMGKEGAEMSILLTEGDVAQRLHVSLASVRRWRLERRGPQFIKVGSLVRYRPEDLELWLAALPTGGSRPEPNGAVPIGSGRVRKATSS